MKPAICVDIVFEDNYLQKYSEYINALRTIVNRSVRDKMFYGIDGEDGLVCALMKELGIKNIYKCRCIIEMLISAMSVYDRDFSKNMFSKTYAAKPLKSGEVKYRFTDGAVGFRWIQNGFSRILTNIRKAHYILIDEDGTQVFREMFPDTWLSGNP